MRENEHILEICRSQNHSIRNLEKAVKIYREKIKENAISKKVYKKLINDSNKNKVIRFLANKTFNETFEELTLSESKEYLKALKITLETTMVNRVKESLKIVGVQFENNEINKIDVPILNRSRSLQEKDQIWMDLEISGVGINFDDNRKVSVESKVFKSFELADLI